MHANPTIIQRSERKCERSRSSSCRFTWIIGTAIAIAFKSAHRKGSTKQRMTLKVLQRGLILALLGLLLESSDGGASVDLAHLRLPGVLQRLAVSYVVVALIEVHFAEDYHANPHQVTAGSGKMKQIFTHHNVKVSCDVNIYFQHTWMAHVRDVLPYWAEWVFMLGLVALHLVLTFMVQVPGCPR